MGVVYLIHFKTPFKHAKHYIGFCEDGGLEERLKRHRQSDGSKLLRAVKQAGIDWEVVRTWEGVDRHFERALKNRKQSNTFCPVCCGNKPPYDLKLNCKNENH